MNLTLLDTKTEVAIADDCFQARFNEPLVHQAVVTYAQRGRSGTSAQKSRSYVRGGGIKPWRQKGTGRARAGSIRSPLWRGGGVVHPAQNRTYNPKLNKKMYRQALRSIFSELLRQERLHVVESFDLAEPKTRLAREKVDALGLSNMLVLVEKMEQNLFMAMRNLPDCDICEIDAADPVALVRYENILLTHGALMQLQQRLAGKAS